METGSIFVQRLLVEMEKGVRPDATRESEIDQSEEKPSKTGPCIYRR